MYFNSTDADNLKLYVRGTLVHTWNVTGAVTPSSGMLYGILGITYP
jgi:hypothetical protein